MGKNKNLLIKNKSIINSQLTFNIETLEKAWNILKITTPQRRYWRRSGVLIVNYEQTDFKPFSSVSTALLLTSNK